jgi:hypothetical protein
MDMESQFDGDEITVLEHTVDQLWKSAGPEALNWSIKVWAAEIGAKTSLNQFANRILLTGNKNVLESIITNGPKKLETAFSSPKSDIERNIPNSSSSSRKSSPKKSRKAVRDVEDFRDEDVELDEVYSNSESKLRDLIDDDISKCAKLEAAIYPSYGINSFALLYLFFVYSYALSLNNYSTDSSFAYLVEAVGCEYQTPRRGSIVKHEISQGAYAT